jgi:hypothetical protein
LHSSNVFVERRRDPRLELRNCLGACAGSCETHQLNTSNQMSVKLTTHE